MPSPSASFCAGPAFALPSPSCLLNSWFSWGLAGGRWPREHAVVRILSVSRSASPASPWRPCGRHWGRRGEMEHKPFTWFGALSSLPEHVLTASLVAGILIAFTALVAPRLAKTEEALEPEDGVT